MDEQKMYNFLRNLILKYIKISLCFQDKCQNRINTSKYINISQKNIDNIYNAIYNQYCLDDTKILNEIIIKNAVLLYIQLK